MRKLQVFEWAENQSAWLRLEDQIAWYDNNSLSAQKKYKFFKFVQIFLAVLIPLAIHLPANYVQCTTAIAGSTIAVLEAVQHMNQYSTLWVMYRSTAEFLKHEKFLFLAAAGPYKGLSNEARLITLAERVEERVSTEHANWFNETKKLANSKQVKDSE